jgi:hypothetical protein
MKKGKITAVESSCLKGMIADGISIEDMCNQLDRSNVIVEKEVNRIKEESVREQLFINKTASGSKGVSVMTEAASTMGDVTKERSVIIPKDNRSPWIHKIK